MGALGGRGGSLASTRVLQERKKVKHFMRACVFWGNGLEEILGRFQRGSGRALGGIGWGGLAWVVGLTQLAWLARLQFQACPLVPK